MKSIRYKRVHDWYQLVEEASHYTGIKPLKAGGNAFVDITESGLITMRVGYAWNGATGALDTKSIMRGCALHDAGYQLTRLGYISEDDRPILDWLLFDMVQADGLYLAESLPWLLRGPARALARARAVWVHAGVRLGGGVFIRWPERSEEILTAP